MSDQAIRAFNKQTRTNPITQGGRVADNVFPDRIEFQKRRIAMQNNSSLYKGPVTDAHYHMAAGEIALMKRSQNGEVRYTATGESTMYVTTALNGAGDETQTREDFIEEHNMAGIIQLWIEHDSSDKQADTAGAIVIGGLFTIPNTGPERIVAGDLVYWDVPDPSLPAVQANKHIDGTPDDKIQPFMRRYIPSAHGATKRSVFRHLATLLSLPNADTTVASMHKSERSKYAGYGAAFYSAMKMGVLLGCATLEEVQGRAQDDNALVQLGKILGITGSRDEASAKVAAEFDTLFVQKLFGMSLGATGEPVSGTPNTLLFPAHAQGYVDKGPNAMDKIELSNRQATVVDEMLTGLKGMSHFIGRRVFGIARGTGDPGDDIDVDIGVYQL